MSRIGKKPIPIPNGVEVKWEGCTVKVKGPKGSVEKEIPDVIDIKKKDNMLVLKLKEAFKDCGNLYGLSRTLVANMIKGVTEGFSKTLEIVGTGYSAEMKTKNMIELELGYSHKIHFPLPEGITAEVGEKKQKITISGIDKQLVGQVSADIRRLRPPEPYKGKGIRYEGEAVRRKAGKAGKTVG